MARDYVSRARFNNNYPTRRWVNYVCIFCVALHTPTHSVLSINNLQQNKLHFSEYMSVMQICNVHFIDFNVSLSFSPSLSLSTSPSFSLYLFTYQSDSFLCDSFHMQIHIESQAYKKNPIFLFEHSLSIHMNVECD